MLAQLEKPTNDFYALANYLVQGRSRPPSPDRVAWVMARNLPTDDPMQAAALMAATAELSARCKRACYHTIIAWAKEERPSPEAMQEIAAKTLALAGLGEHQAFVVGHGDKAHAHLHMMINRVHPETGRAWSTSHDYRRFDRIMQQLAGEHGFQYVPAHAFNRELTDDLPKGPASGAAYAAKRGAPTNRVQWSRRTARAIGEGVSEGLDRAATWDDAAFAFAEMGLSVEAKGSGLVAGHSMGYVKFSALGLEESAHGLARRFGGAFADRSVAPRLPTRRPWWQVDAVDIVRMLGSQEDVREAINEATGQRKARRGRLPLMEQLMAEVGEGLREGTSLKSQPKRKFQRAPRREPGREGR